MQSISSTRDYILEAAKKVLWEERPSVEQISKALLKTGLRFDESDVIAIEQHYEAKYLKIRIHGRTTIPQARQQARYEVFTVSDTPSSMTLWVMCVAGMPHDPIPHKVSMNAPFSRMLTDDQKVDFRAQMQRRADVLNAKSHA